MKLAFQFALAAACRVALLLLGEWQDAHLAVKYTDVDYQVFTDAARFVARGESPYQRSTYRYTPILAYMLLPNVWVHPAWGKVLFTLADLLAGWLVAVLLRLQGVPHGDCELSVALWLFNPFTVTISTRGNGEALVTVLLLLTLLALQRGQVVVPALLFGTAVHWRIYPVIYSLPLALFLGRRATRPTSSLWNLLTVKPVLFGLISLATFLGLGALFYKLYGLEFLEEAYLYHTTRRDPRHNFSSYFYPTYLSVGGEAAVHTLDRLATVTQLGTTAVLGWGLVDRLTLCMMLQTMAFVTLNKVCTAQYFVWYFGLLSLALPCLRRGALLGIGALWLVLQLHWLGWAYAAEFQGQPVFLGIWAAGIAFQVANVWMIVMLMRSAEGTGSSSCGKGL